MLAANSSLAATRSNIEICENQGICVIRNAYSIYPDTLELESWSILTSSFMLEQAGYAGSGEVAVKCCNFEETMLQIAITEEILTEFG